MLDVRDLLRRYSKQFTNDTIRHVLLNWSETEQCIRHPSAPIGWIIRDQGQLHLYSGKSHIVLGIDGDHVSMATNYAVHSENINMVPNNIRNFRILGKSFRKQLFDGQSIIAPKTDLKGHSIIGPGTKVNVGGVVGDIIGAVPMESVFDITSIFENDPNDANLLPAAAEVYNFLDQVMG